MSNNDLSTAQPEPQSPTAGIGGSQSFRIKSMKKNKIQKTRTVGGHEDSKGLTNSDAADSDATGNSKQNEPAEGGKEWVKRLESDPISILQPKRPGWRPVCHCGNPLTAKHWCTRCSLFCLSNGPILILCGGDSTPGNASTPTANMSVNTSSDAIPNTNNNNGGNTPESQFAMKLSPRDSPLSKQRSASRSGKERPTGTAQTEKSRSYTTGNFDHEGGRPQLTSSTSGLSAAASNKQHSGLRKPEPHLINLPTPRLLSPTEQSLSLLSNAGGESRSELTPVEMELKKLVNEHFENIHHGIERILTRPEPDVKAKSVRELNLAPETRGLWNIPPRTLAEQITFSDQMAFAAMYSEIVEMTSWDSVTYSFLMKANQINENFQKLALAILSEICVEQDLYFRQNLLICTVETMEELYKMHNLHSMMAVYAVLTSHILPKLKKTYSALSSQHHELIHKISLIVPSTDNYRAMRNYITTLQKPGNRRQCCVPYIKLFDKEIAEVRQKTVQLQDEAKAKYLQIHYLIDSPIQVIPDAFIQNFLRTMWCLEMDVLDQLSSELEQKHNFLATIIDAKDSKEKTKSNEGAALLLSNIEKKYTTYKTLPMNVLALVVRDLLYGKGQSFYKTVYCKDLFLTGVNGEVSFHKRVLQVRCPKFLETIGASKEKQKLYTKETLLAFFDYLYLDTLNFSQLSQTQCLQLYKLANESDAMHLKFLMYSYLESQMTASNSISYAFLARDDEGALGAILKLAIYVMRCHEYEYYVDSKFQNQETLDLVTQLLADYPEDTPDRLAPVQSKLLEDFVTIALNTIL